MFLDNPVLETAFRVVVWLVIGIPILIIIWSLFSTILTAVLTVVFMQVAIVVAFAGYLIGIPWSIGFRLRNGRWPE